MAGFPSHKPYPYSLYRWDIGEDSSILGTVEMFGASLGASESWEFTGTSKGSCWRRQGWRWDARWKCRDFYSASTFSGVLSRWKMWKMAMNWLGEVESCQGDKGDTQSRNVPSESILRSGTNISPDQRTWLFSYPFGGLSFFPGTPDNFIMGNMKMEHFFWKRYTLED